MATNKTLVTIIKQANSNAAGGNTNSGTAQSETVSGVSAGYPLPDPTDYSFTTTTMIDGGTSVSGHLLSSTVRSDIAQISLAWNYLDAKVWSEINKLFNESFINTVIFYDQTKGDWDSREMQISERTAGLWRRDTKGDVLGWTGCSIKLTEV